MTHDIQTLTTAADEHRRVNDDFLVDGPPKVLLDVHSAKSIECTDDEDGGEWLVSGARSGTTADGEVIWIEINTDSSPLIEADQTPAGEETIVNLSYIDEHLREAYERWCR